MSKPQVFRSGVAYVLGWIWVVFAVGNALDLAIRGRTYASVVAAGVLIAITAVVYVTALRPRIVLRDDGLMIRNPLRDAFIPWRAVDDVDAGTIVTVWSGDTKVRAWTPQSSARQRAKALRKAEKPSGMSEQAADQMRGRTHVDWVASQIRERAEKAVMADNAGHTARLSWSIPALAAVVASLLLLLAIILFSP